MSRWQVQVAQDLLVVLDQEMVVVVAVVLVVPVSHVEMEVHQLQQHRQAVLASVIQLQEQQRITAVAVVHLGLEAQAVGLVQAVLVAAGKEQTALAQVRTELQILAVAAVEATTA
jgi:hypothetical protein